jgi:D-alanine--poly(phosphoribitol) ligase subunit 2
MTSADQISTRIPTLIGEVLFVDPPAPDDDLIEAEYIDSLAVVSLIDAIEGEFGIQLPLDEFEIDDFRTAGRISDYVAKQVPGGQPG